MRRDLKELEKKFADFIGVKYAIGVNSGTDALSLSMRAAGIVPGDEVITVSHTFMASISVICHQGAVPVLVDVGEDYTMNPALIEEAITPKTKAIEPVHLNGRMCDMDKIMRIANEHRLLVIEDAAQALGAKFRSGKGKWKKAGSFGLAGCFSLYPFKALGAFGDAGVVTTNSAELAKKLRLLRYNGEDRKTGKFYFHGYSALLDNVQAALLNVKFRYFNKWIEQRRTLAEYYWTGLKDVKDIVLPNFRDPRYFDIYQNYVIRAKKRNQLFNHFKKNGVETMIKDSIPNHRQKAMGLSHFRLPFTEKLAGEVISLPLYPEMSQKEAEYVIKILRNFYNKNNKS